ncbi:hypothetical protein [Isobaculum melis]|uniref:PH domain-containing protein n=1 Tax=Isobaculum melis TaxID=142588 RepID=A0A1H9UJD9_9LACT|nr:hypothetical protein [Isobaculum melis]SES09449.1 hypothetical protein SAMN04488559_1338 [Isobaculum melis]
MENEIKEVLKQNQLKEENQIYLFSIKRPSYGLRLMMSVFVPFFTKNYITCFGENGVVILSKSSMSGKLDGEYEFIPAEDIEHIFLERKGLYYLLSIHQEDDEVFHLEIPGRYGTKKWHNEGFKKLQDLYGI